MSSIKRVVPDPYSFLRPKEMASRIGMEKKKFIAALDFKHGFGSMGLYKDHSKYITLTTPFGVFIPTRLGVGGKNGTAKMRRIADHLFADLPFSFCLYR